MLKVQLRRNKQYISQYKICNFNCCTVQLPNFFFLRFSQWSVLFCRNGSLELILSPLSSLKSTRSWFLLQPCSSKFFTSLSIKLLRVAFFCIFCKILKMCSPFTCLGGVCGSPLQSKHPLFLVLPCEFLRPKCCFCAFEIFWRTEEVSLNIPISKNSQLLNNDHICKLNM